MTAPGPDRGMECPSGSWRTPTGEPGNTTARWQDKGARCAPEFGRAFSRAYVENSRGAPDRRGLRLWKILKQISMIVRCADSPP